MIPKKTRNGTMGQVMGQRDKGIMEQVTGQWDNGAMRNKMEPNKIGNT